MFIADNVNGKEGLIWERIGRGDRKEFMILGHIQVQRGMYKVYKYTKEKS